MIEVEALRKTYRVPVRAMGLWAAATSLLRRTYRDVVAVDGVTFKVEGGETVGFLGPNGAGKTTTLKMLAGLLRPTGGHARVLGKDPGERDRSFLRSITLVMGQKNQLAWDLPPIDSFDFHRVIYDLAPSEFRATMKELDALLELGPLVNKPVRQLSLGERMRCELALALLHRPRLLFLDEPTIGLDVALKASVRTFLRDYGKRHGATMLITSHDMDDVTALCSRVIVIDRGALLYDGGIDALVKKMRPEKHLVLHFEREVGDAELLAIGPIESHSGVTATLRVPRDGVKEAVARAIASMPVVDLTVENPPLEQVMVDLFKTHRPPSSGGVP
jgi:ABC-2 type transport system ATP-binding protein